MVPNDNLIKPSSRLLVAGFVLVLIPVFVQLSPQFSDVRRAGAAQRGSDTAPGTRLKFSAS
jgi:hypothetical protein